MVLRLFILLGVLSVYMENSLWFEISLGQIEICTKVSYTSPELMWMQIMKLLYTEVKFYPEVKTQTGSHVNMVLEYDTVFAKKIRTERSLYLYADLYVTLCS